VSYNACVAALVQGRHHRLAAQLFGELDGTQPPPPGSAPPGPHLQPDAVSFQLALAALAGGGDGGGARLLLGRMDRQERGAPRPDAQAYGALARAAAAAGDAALAAQAKSRARSAPAGAGTGVAGGVAPQWACPSCGWRNRPQNSVCGGSSGAATARPAYGCGKLRPGPESGGSGASAAPKLASQEAAAAVIASAATTTEPRDYFYEEDEDSDEKVDAEDDDDDDDDEDDDDDAVWTISEGQAVEVWDGGQLVMGNAMLREDAKSSGGSMRSGPPALTLRVLVFDPSVDLVGGAKDDDVDEGNAARRAQVAAKATEADAARAVRRVALDQVIRRVLRLRRPRPGES
jgi:hypothetical protein